MADRYALTCPSCSAINEVDLRQAGESIACVKCQTSVEVPTLRGFRQLQPLGDQNGNRRKASSGSTVVARATFVAGFVALLIGLGTGGGFWYFASILRTQPPQAEIDKMNAAFFARLDGENLPEFWKTWQEDVIGLPPSQWRESGFAANRKLARQRRLAGNLFFALVPLGLAAMIGSAFIRK